MDNEDNAGIVHMCKLKMPFEKAVVCLFESWQRILMLQSERQERVCFQMDSHSNWEHKKINIPGKFTVKRFIGRFAIVSYNDGLIYLVELDD